MIQKGSLSQSTNCPSWSLLPLPLILTPTLMRLDSDPCRLNPLYRLDEVTEFDLSLPISSHSYCCVNDGISDISTADVVSISCKLIDGDVLCQWQLWHQMSAPDLSSAVFVWQWEVEMAYPRLKRLIIVLDQVRGKDHHAAKFLEADEQLAPHRVNGLLGPLGDLGEPLGEQRIGFIDKQNRLLSLGCMKDRLDIFWSLPMKLALNLRIARH